MDRDDLNRIYPTMANVIGARERIAQSKEPQGETEIYPSAAFRKVCEAAAERRRRREEAARKCEEMAKQSTQEEGNLGEEEGVVKDEGDLDFDSVLYDDLHDEDEDDTD